MPLIDGEGLYPSGLNVPPQQHLINGQAVAQLLRARPKNVLLSIGMSNANQKFERFRRDELSTTDKAANLVIVNGASGKKTSDNWANPADDAYTAAGERLAAAGVTPNDVGLLWTELTEAGNDPSLASWRATVTADTGRALQTLVSKYPNVRMIFMSARTYGGCEKAAPNGTGLNPEPYAFTLGLINKDLIGEHLAGLLLPDRWIGWGPYWWADGLSPRSDGLIWPCSDFSNDGVHPSSAGAMKAAILLSSFFRTDLVARIWFLQTP